MTDIKEALSMSTNKKLSAFRETATDAQWKKLVEDHANLSPAEFSEKYGFSWSGIFPTAVDLGYYTPSRTARHSGAEADAHSKPAVAPAAFTVSPENAQGPLISRSVQLTKAIVERLKAVEEKYPQYTKRAILNQIIDDGLRRSGF